MKKLAILFLTVFAVSLTSASYAANFFTDSELQDNDSVIINLTFEAGTTWNLSIVDSDNEGSENDVTSIDTTTGLSAMGDDYKVVGVAYLKAQASGTWEIVTYTDNFNDLSIPLPANYNTVLDNDGKNNWYGTIGGLKHDTYALYLPIKVRSQGIDGIADNDGLRATGDTIPAAYCLTDKYSENYGYIPEVEPENLALVINTEAGPAVAGTKVVAQIGLTPKSTLDRNPQVAFGIEEGMAGSGDYSTTVFFDLRGN